jgi:hypothetical protein
MKAAGVNPASSTEVPGVSAAEAVTNSTTLTDTAQIAPGTPPAGLLGAALPSAESQQDNGARTAAPEPQTAFPLVRIAEIILAVIAVGFGLAAYILRRSAGV